MERVIKYVILVSLSIFVSNAQRGGRNRCLKNLRVIGSTPSSITLGWDYKCATEADGDGGMRYKVYYEHLEWRACPSGHQDERRGGPGRGNYETTETVVVFEQLHPYSAYRLTVKALPPVSSQRQPEEVFKIGETLQDVPDVLPEQSSIPTKVTSTGLAFYWHAPSPSKCQDFNGVLDGVNFVLRGTEKWNLEEEHSDMTSEKSHSFEHLSPFSSYILFLYSQNREGKHNINLPYRIKAKTGPARPTPPRDLADATISFDRSQRVITWLPPYPPTGEIEEYSLRWKRSNSTHWESEKRVYPGDALCPESVLDPSASPLNRTVCHVVSDLSANQNYTFQASAFNHGITERSLWGGILVSGPSTSEVILGLEKSVFIVVVVVSLVGVLLIVLVFTFCSYHCNKKSSKKKYKNVPNYVSGPMGSTVTASTSFSYPPINNGMSPPNRNSSFNTSQGSAAAATVGEASMSFSSAQTEDTLRRYKPHFLPAAIDRNSRTGSIQEQPLPPLPRDDHLYEELKLKKEPSPASSAKSRASSGGEAQYLRPTGLPLSTNLNATSKGSDLNESDYLAPRTAAASASTARSRNASSDTIDMDDYLKPTFDRFEHIDPTDMSPPREAPPPIPVVSYGTGAQQKF